MENTGQRTVVYSDIFYAAPFYNDNWDILKFIAQ